MKTQTITLTHLPDILLVVLPEEAKEYHIAKDYQGSYLCWDDCTTYFERQQFGDHGQFKFCDNPRNNWSIVGMLPEVTEKQVAGMVKSTIRLGFFSGNLFKDYESDGFTFDTALESFHSAIRARGHYIGHNPLGKEREHKKKYKGHDMFFADHMVKWHEAQSRVLNPELTLILERK